MSIDRSLKSKDSLVRHRNVLTRSERVAALEEEQRWSEEDSVLALPKVVHRKAVVVKKDKAVTEEAGPAVGEAKPTAEDKKTGQSGQA